MTLNQKLSEKKEPCHDMNHRWNSSKFHNGYKCIEKDCKEPAGTAWSPHWCKYCNSKRMKKIDESLGSMIKGKSNGI